MKSSLRRAKDVLTLPLLAGVRATQPLPGVQRFLLAGVLASLKCWYHLPGNRVRKTIGNFCRVVGRDDPSGVFAESVEKLRCAAGMYGELMRHGPERLVDRVEFDADILAHCEAAKEEHGGGIIVMPHCIGAVPVAAGFARRFPSLLLVTESRSVLRSELVRRCFDKMQVEVAYVRRHDPAAAARSILRALHERKFVIGTTDLLRRTKDSVEVRMFGQPAHLPAWPARFSARRKAPIIPGFVHLDGERILPSVGAPYIEQDAVVATQRWAGFFEENFRRYPSEWIFLYEKRWSALIAQAAQTLPGPASVASQEDVSARRS